MKMKKINKDRIFGHSGFTLMELLIVIGVLGILAAGLLAAIDPFEQLKKARDTNNRSAAIEFLGASQRYYATHGYLPWYKPGIAAGSYDASCTDVALTWDAIRPITSGVTYPRPAVKAGIDLSTGVVFDCITNTLGTDGEIKTTFFTGLKTPIYIMSGSPTSVAICFAPEGKSNLSDPQSKYVYDATAKTIDNATPCSQTEKDTGLCLQCFE